MSTVAVDVSEIEQPTHPAKSDCHLNHLKRAIEKAGLLLPAQGPLTAFAFLNTLEALEELPFEEGIIKGGRLFGCQPFLPEEKYREHLLHGRIQLENVQSVLKEDLGDRCEDRFNSLPTSLFELRQAMLQYTLRTGPAEELRWFVAETNALTEFRADAPIGLRDTYIAQTRHWIMRNVRGANEADKHEEIVRYEAGARELLGDVLKHYGEESIEQWTPKIWEEVSLKALWLVCQENVKSLELPSHPHSYVIRHRDLMLEVTGHDSDALVNEVLIRFCAAFSDQGFADWQLPNREAGFFQAFCSLFKQTLGPPDRWMQRLPREIDRIEQSQLSPLETIAESLKLLGVAEEDWDDYVAASILALKGWGGILRQMEVRGDRVALPVPEGTLVEFLAVRLILVRLALEYLAQETLDYRGPLSNLRDVLLDKLGDETNTSVEQRALLVFQIAQILSWSPQALFQLTVDEWGQLVHEIECFSGLQRRRILHWAFERQYRNHVLDAITLRMERPPRNVERPRFQAAFCIDAREESFRRHLEEIAPDVETFALAGFFCIPIYYRGIGDAHYAALCPIVVRPQHWLIEEPIDSMAQAHQRRARTRRALGTASHRVHVGSRGFAGGALLTATFGVLASIPLVARVLFPRLTARIRKQANRFVDPPRLTRLRLERTAVKPSAEDDGIGFSVEEMANFGERVLRDIGILKNMSRLVIFFGHGSACLNNPHKSTYDCGACSGSAGGPNARTLAAMLNDKRARAILATRGIQIPETTVFLGALHNTATDTLSFYDLDMLPVSHQRDFDAALVTLEETCERNAHERCRRFQSAPLNISYANAHAHVEGRSEDLAQARPEFGNATNAIVFVGRRERIRGLYMDRRAFQHSYDPTQDDANHTILARILAPVVPVCEGINMTYFLSAVDVNGWGAGTKLPHNVASLLGVMDGYSSDLRTGLPFQSIEIHEPMRLVFVVETTPEAILSIMDRLPQVGRILRNGWGQLALLDPNSSQLQVYHRGQFYPYRSEIAELPTAPTSLDWYRGWREHLGFALTG